MEHRLRKPTNAWINRDRLRRWGPAVLLVVAATAAWPLLIGPSCPDRIVIATGRSDGAYHAFAAQYRTILARDGVTLELRETAGSVENLELLENDDDVSLAFIQGGVGREERHDGVESLASVYLEPVWVFTSGDEPVTMLSDLAGRRIAVGAAGSGTRAVALELLRDNGVDVSSVETGGTTLPLSGRDAADALLAERVDAAFFVISPEAPLVRELLEAESIRLMDFVRADAYEQRYPYLTTARISRGLIDLDRDLPRSDVVVIAPTANLAARDDLHPALVPLLLKAAVEVHGDGGLLEKPGAFPSARHAGFAVRSAARQYLRSGPSWLYRYLPFQTAAWLNRMKLMMLPLFTLLLPLLKVAPPVYRWRIRSRIYRWYRVLRRIDQKLQAGDAGADFSADVAGLDALEAELSEVKVPLSYMEEFYNLRLHVAFVRERLLNASKFRIEGGRNERIPFKPPGPSRRAA